ncbi:unnamed protein product [Rotaria socialis]
MTDVIDLKKATTIYEKWKKFVLVDLHIILILQSFTPLANNHCQKKELGLVISMTFDNSSIDENVQEKEYVMKY